MASVFNRGDRKRPLWWLKFRGPDGRIVRCPAADLRSGTKARTRGDAEAILATVEADILRGAFRMESRHRTPGVTVAELCERFWREYASPRVRDVERYRRSARAALRTHVLPRFGDRDAETLTAADVEALRDAVLASRSRQTALHVLNRLSRAYGWAERHGLVRRRDNPVRGVDKPPGPRTGEPVRPEEYLTRPEVERLLAWAREHQPIDFPVYATAVYTGLRQGEMLRLRWGDVDLDAGRILVREAKSGVGRVVPIDRPLRAILAAWRQEPWQADDGLVFGEPKGGPRWQKTLWKHFRRACAGSGVRGVRFHDLRHTCASLLLMAGVDLVTVSRLLGHASTTMTLRYSHLAPDHLAAAVGKLRLDLGERGQVIPLRSARTSGEGTGS